MAIRQANKPQYKQFVTPEAEEQELISLAIQLTRKQLKEGTASASTINHFLKLASSRERIEREVIAKQVELLEAKAENIKRNEGEAQAYLDVIDALKNYSPEKMS